MLILRPCASPPCAQATSSAQFSRHINWLTPFSTVTLARRSHAGPNPSVFVSRHSRDPKKTVERAVEDDKEDDDGDDDIVDVYDDEKRSKFSARMAFRRREEEKHYARDPEIAEIMGSSLDDPKKTRSKIEERLRRKRNKILRSKTGSATPMKVTFNKFDFTNSYIWFEFYNAPLEKDVALICDTIRSWHIIGRLGGCNSLNMQLSEMPMDQRPTYDASQGANVEPTSFYNIGDLEVQDNLARIWVDVGIKEPLLLDVLINALTQISSDYVGIKQLVFGAAEFSENWNDNCTSEDPSCSTHKI